jgi:hypothetical protein
VDGTYLFGATLLYKINASATARMRGRLVLNGTTEIRGSLGEISATHVSLATAIWLQTMVPLTAGDTVELQGYFRVADGYFAADHTSFWGCKFAFGSASGDTLLAVLLFLLTLRRSGERAGRLAERLETSEKVNDVQRQMLDAAARRPRDRDDLGDRLRDGRF